MPELTKISSLDPRALRTKGDDFALSRQQGLPDRCPLLEHCERRSSHDFKLGRNYSDPGGLPAAPPKDPVVPMIEGATRVGETNSFFVQHLCPEVALFEPDEAFPGLSGYPTTSRPVRSVRHPEVRTARRRPFLGMRRIHRGIEQQ